MKIDPDQLLYAIYIGKVVYCYSKHCDIEWEV